MTMRGLWNNPRVGLAVLWAWALVLAPGAYAVGAGPEETLHEGGSLFKWAAIRVKFGCFSGIAPYMAPHRIIIGHAPATDGVAPGTVNKGLTEEDLMIPEVNLVSKCGAMSRPEGIVYSTAPESALADDGKRYVIKGAGDVAVVMGELIGYKFAQVLRIPVPGFGVGRFGGEGEPVFACALLEDVFRDTSAWFAAGKVANMDAVLRLLALDAWIANNDRNMNNLLGRAAANKPGEIEVVAIDFEKARVARSETPLVEIPTMKPSSFWPTGDLGRLCRQKLKLDLGVVKEFSKLSEACVNRVVDSCVLAVGNSFTRRDSVCTVLNKRLDKLGVILKEVWS